MNRILVLLSAALVGLAICPLVTYADTAVVSGSATYRERIALPQGALLEVILEDISLADAPSVRLGVYSAQGPGSPPFDFEIAYDPALVVENHRYAIRARVSIEGRLIFTTDTVHPVLTNGAGNSVDVMMIAVGETAASPETDADDEPPVMQGMIAFLNERAVFLDCSSGETWPVAREGDFEALEHAYLATGIAPDEHIMATFEGKVASREEVGDGEPGTAVVVGRFLGVWPDETCERATSSPGLTNTYWLIRQLDGADITPEDGRRDAHMVLRGDEDRFTATIGCNQFMGGYTADGEALVFAPETASTAMACNPPYLDWELALRQVFATAAFWRIDGDRLEILDAERRPVALLEAADLD